MFFQVAMSKKKNLYKNSPENSIKKRFSNEFGKGLVIELLDYIIGEDGYYIYNLEQIILNETLNYIVDKNKYILENGNTELRIKRINIKEYIEHI